MKPTEKKPFRTTVVIRIDGLYDPTRMDEDEARETAAGKAVGDALAHIHTVEDGLEITDIINLLQQEQPNNMIQWTGNNLKEVIDFTGKSPRFEEWFKSWHEYENYVHTHNDILKLFCEDGSHYEVPVGAWIVKTPDGYNLPSVAKYIQQDQPEVDLEKEIDKFLNETGAPYVWCNDDEQKEWCNIIARHFYELGLKARKEE